MLVELNEKEVEMITSFRRKENEVIEVDHIDQNNYKKYIGKTVKVLGNVDLTDLGLTKIPINFTEVGGDFNCWYNKLSSLAGAPKKVGKIFDCSYNKLTSLEGAPKEYLLDRKKCPQGIQNPLPFRVVGASREVS